MLKKLLAYILCAVIVLTAFNLAVFSGGNAVSAAAEQNVESFAELSADNDNFVYIATEFYEPGEDNSYSQLSDHIVTPGMKLKVKAYLKTDLYLGTGIFGFTFDNRFFDIQNGTGEFCIATPIPVNTAGNSDLSAAGVYASLSGNMLSDVPVVKAGKLLVPDKVVNSSYTLPLSDMSVAYAGYKRDISSVLCYECNDDAYFLEFYVTVRNGLVNGTEGYSFADPVTYTFYKNIDDTVAVGKPPFDVKTSADPETEASKCIMMSTAGFTFENVLLDDTHHLFKVVSDIEETTTEIPEGTTQTPPEIAETFTDVTQPEEPDDNGNTQEPETEEVFEFAIRDTEMKKISYADSLILRTEYEPPLPEDWVIVWSSNNTKFNVLGYSEDYSACLITPAASGETVFTATVYDAQENVIATDSITIKSDAGFFAKLIGFFKKLFKLTKVYDI